MNDPICPLCKNPILDGDCIITRQGLTFHSGCGEGPLAWPVVIESLHARIAALEDFNKPALRARVETQNEQLSVFNDQVWKLRAQVDKLTMERDNFQIDLRAERERGVEKAMQQGEEYNRMISERNAAQVRADNETMRANALERERDAARARAEKLAGLLRMSYGFTTADNGSLPELIKAALAEGE